MRYIAALFAIVLAAAAWPRLALASACSTDRYMHNGSAMDIQVCDGGALTISYARPRPGMQQQGARQGSLLFDGAEAADGGISGQARLFSARCGVVTYSVSGSRQGNVIVLRGTAPIRGQGCNVVRHRQDHLVFTSAQDGSGSPGGPDVVAPECPLGFSLSGGQCIRDGSGTGAPPPGGKDWHAIAGSSRNQRDAQNLAGQLGGSPWHAMNTSRCPNFRNGYWIATAGPFSRSQAQAYAASASHYGAYIKTCH